MAIKRKPYFYDAQIKRYLMQIMVYFAGYQVKTGNLRDGKSKFIDVPIWYGGMSRTVAKIIGTNGQDNTVNSLPIISIYDTGMQQSNEYRLSPQHVEKFSYIERARDANGKLLVGGAGKRKTVERHMPVPYDMDITVAIWGSNEDQVKQIWEQIAVVFNPDVELQLSNSPADWSFMTILEYDGNMTKEWVTPSGSDTDPMFVINMNFRVKPVWLSAPVKVYETKYIQSIHVPIKDLEEAVGFDDMMDLDKLVIKADEDDIEFIQSIDTSKTPYQI